VFYTVGQITPWGTITVHEFAFLIEKLRDYTVAHEYAHKRQWYRYAIYPFTILFILWPVLPFVLLAVILLSIQAITTSTGIYAVNAAVTLFAFAFVLAIPTIFSWALEFQADCYAIRQLGMSNILSAIAEGKALAETRGCKKPDFLSRALGRLTHPPLSFTYRFCCLLHRSEFEGIS